MARNGGAPELVTLRDPSSGPCFICIIPSEPYCQKHGARVRTLAEQNVNSFCRPYRNDWVIGDVTAALHSSCEAHGPARHKCADRHCAAKLTDCCRNLTPLHLSVMNSYFSMTAVLD